MNVDYYSDFFRNKPDTELQFKELGVKFNIPIEKNLKAIIGKDEFLAEIIELRFGVLFGTHFKQIEQKKKVFPELLFKPDWTVTTNSQIFVAEVIRLNPSQNDSIEIDFSSNIINALQQIPLAYVIKLKYKYEDIAEIKIDKIKREVEDWLNRNPETGNYTTLFDNKIRIEVLEKDFAENHVCVIGSFRLIKFDYRRLTGDKSRLLSKLKYADAVLRHNLPYIICIHLSFESWFKPEDLYERLYGCSAVFHNDFPFKDYYPNAEFHKFSEGLYYSNEIVKKSVSGIIAYYQNEFTFFPNYSHVNRLDNSTKEILNKYLYEKLTELK